ncbi:MAG: alpha/beta hydrolase fold domain-containing protein [Myxococcota bacterium]
MASPQLATVIEMLRANPLGGETVLEMRAKMEAASAAAPMPEATKLVDVDAQGAKAQWTDADGARGDAAFVYLHGGGYVMGSLVTHRNLVANLSRQAGIRALSVDYRLAPEHPFPPPSKMPWNAVLYVQSQGIAPDRIVVAGDSAGGGLTAATLLALRDRGHAMPAAGVLISPWLDLTQSGDTIRSLADADPMVTLDLLTKSAAAYAAKTDPKAPLVSPLFADLAGLPPLLIHVGTAEILLDDARRFAAAAKAAGVDATLEEWPDMIHVWHSFAGLLPESQQAVDRIAAFVKEQIG